MRLGIGNCYLFTFHKYEQSSFKPINLIGLNGISWIAFKNLNIHELLMTEKSKHGCSEARFIWALSNNLQIAVSIFLSGVNIFFYDIFFLNEIIFFKWIFVINFVYVF